MAHMKLFTAVSFVALVYSTTARYLQEAEEEQRFSNHWDLQPQEKKKPCELIKFGQWSDRLNVSVSPNPVEYEKGFQVSLEFYVYDDLWFGTASASMTQVDGTWHYTFSGILCDAKFDCPWHKGDTLKFQDSVAPPSTYIDKGTYNANMAIYNEEGELILGFGFRNCTIS